MSGTSVERQNSGGQSATSTRRVHSATSTAPAIIQPVIDVAAKYGYITRAFPAEELYFRP